MYVDVDIFMLIWMSMLMLIFMFMLIGQEALKLLNHKHELRDNLSLASLFNFKVQIFFTLLDWMFVRFFYLQPPQPNSLTPLFGKNIYTGQLSNMSS